MALGERYAKRGLNHLDNDVTSTEQTFVCVCAQVDGHHGDLAGSGGQPDSSGGGAANSGGAEGPQREEGTAQDRPLLPLPQRALYCTKVANC